MFQKKEVVIDSGRARWGSFTRPLERAPFSPFLSLFGILQCEVPRGHNFLSHLAAGLNLDWSGMEWHVSGMEWHVGLSPAQVKHCFPAPFPVLELRTHGAGHPVSHAHPSTSGSPLIL